jgi:CheY-like chemotaxis protein
MDKKSFVERVNLHRGPCANDDHRAGLRSILVLENVEEDADLFSIGAEEVDCRFVFRAAGTQTAHEIARTRSLYMIVLGCAHTGEEEFRLIKELREITHLSEIPIILFSRDLSEADIGQAFALGVDRVFQKPPTREQYIACCKAIASQESNLDTATLEYEKFPEDLGDLGWW